MANRHGRIGDELNQMNAASATDPFLFFEHPTDPSLVGYNYTRGRTLASSIVADRANTKIIIVDGQSEHATAGGTVAHTCNAASHQLNIYDGGIYAGGIADPPLGASNAPFVGPGSPVMQIADRLIAQAKATRGIMVPLAVGGTSWLWYDPAYSGSLFTRTRAAIRRLAARGLAPDAIIAARGVTDSTLGSSGAAVTAAITAYATGVRAEGCTAPIYLGKFTMLSGATNSTIRTAIDNALNGSLNILAGYDGDTNCTVAGGFRLADGTHLSDTGLTKAANGWADLMFP